LVPSHAYAVLNVVETLNGVRLLQVKNPWNRKRWKGPYSLDDFTNWTPELCKELNFDPELCRLKTDDGMFWIDFVSVQSHFNALFLNWNPELFQYRFTMHKHWPLELGPQFILTLKNTQENIHASSNKVCTVWILLTRHVCAVEGENDIHDINYHGQQFLTLHVYKTKGKKRVFYPNDAFSRGTYSNNPHTLTCIDVVLNGNEEESFVSKTLY